MAVFIILFPTFGILYSFCGHRRLFITISVINKISYNILPYESRAIWIFIFPEKKKKNFVWWFREVFPLPHWHVQLILIRNRTRDNMLDSKNKKKQIFLFCSNDIVILIVTLLIIQLIIMCFVHLCSCQHKYFSSILKYQYIFCNIIKCISTHSRKMSAFTAKNSLSSMVMQTSETVGVLRFIFRVIFSVNIRDQSSIWNHCFIQSALPDIIDTYHIALAWTLLQSVGWVLWHVLLTRI